jgi:dynein heavy chain
MCEWVRAVSEFTDVNNDITKKKTFVEEKNVELNKANDLLKSK